MQKKLIAIAIGFAFVASPAFAGDWMGSNDSGHGGIHDKWKSPGNGPGQGYGHFKDHGDKLGNPGHPDKDKPHGDKPNPGPVNNGGNGGAGGQGGKGGEGGNAQLNAKLSSSAVGVGTGIASSDATGGNAKSASSATGGQGGDAKAAATASNGNVGNDNGAAVSINNTDQSRFVSFMDAPALPATFGTAGLQARKVSECGPRYKITPFERDADVPFLALPFISINRSVPIQTEHGMNGGFDTEKPFELIEFPVPGSDAKFRVIMGHVLYMTTGHDSRGGATTGGANYAGSNAVGVAGGSSANNAYGVLGYVAVPCVYTPPAPPAPPPATPVPPTCVKGAKGGCIPTRLAD